MQTRPSYLAADDLRLFLDREGMTQDDFAALVGADARTVRRWLAGQPVPKAVALLVVLMTVRPELALVIEREANYMEEIQKNHLTSV